MNKIDKQIVLDYINGNDINDYEVDDLENNREFMLEVLKVSHDKNMYMFCSDEVKKNYEFVKSVIEIFKEDKDFIKIVADYFLSDRQENIEEDFESTELNIIMCNLLANTEDLSVIKYALISNMNFVAISKSMLEISEEKNYQDGYGFTYAEIYYEAYPIIIDFFAKKLLQTIFYEDENEKFDTIIHKLTKKKEMLSNALGNAFLIDAISHYDLSLASYCSIHLELLEPLKKELKHVEKDWDGYIARANENKTKVLAEEITDLYCTSVEEPKFDKMELEALIIQELNLEKYYKPDDYEELDPIDIEFMKEEIEESSNARQIYLDATKAAKKIFNIPTRKNNIKNPKIVNISDLQKQSKFK